MQTSLDCLPCFLRQTLYAARLATGSAGLQQKIMIETAKTGDLILMKSGCSAFDCEFIVLAQDLVGPLVTVDKQVLAQFPEVAYIARSIPEAQE